MAQYIIPLDTLQRFHKGSRVYKTDGEPGTTAPTAGQTEEVLENPTVIPTELLRRFKHTFLVRTPEKAVPSYWKCVQGKMAGFEFFDGAEAGFEELRLLYKWISNPDSTFHKGESAGGSLNGSSTSYPGSVQSQPLPPPLIDAAVLIANPTASIKHLCDSTGIPFETSMLSWDAKPQAEFAKWGDYHKGAENSTGFGQAAASEADDKNNKATVDKKAEKADLPQDVQDTITRNMDAYNWLAARKTVQA